MDAADTRVHSVLRTELCWLLEAYSPRFLASLLGSVEQALQLLAGSDGSSGTNTLPITSNGNSVTGVVALDGSELVRVDLDVDPSSTGYLNQGYTSFNVSSNPGMLPRMVRNHTRRNTRKGAVLESRDPFTSIDIAAVQSQQQQSQLSQLSLGRQQLLEQQQQQQQQEKRNDNGSSDVSPVANATLSPATPSSRESKNTVTSPQISSNNTNNVNAVLLDGHDSNEGMAKISLRATKGVGLKLRQLDSINNLLMNLAADISSFFAEESQVESNNENEDWQSQVDKITNPVNSDTPTADFVDRDTLTARRISWICEKVDSTIEQAYNILSFRDPVECFPNTQLNRRIRELESTVIQHGIYNLAHCNESKGRGLICPIDKTLASIPLNVQATMPSSLDVDFFVNVQGLICIQITSLKFTSAPQRNPNPTVLIGGRMSDNTRRIQQIQELEKLELLKINDETKLKELLSIKEDVVSPKVNVQSKDNLVEGRPALVVGSTVVGVHSPKILQLTSLLADIKRQSVGMKTKLNFLVQT